MLLTMENIYTILVTSAREIVMAKFNTAAEAKQVGAALFAAGKCAAWTDYRHFGAHILRVQVGGRWWNLMASEVA
jgi:hypothetical protein